MHDGGVHHPSTSTSGASAGAVSPVVVNATHTGAGFFIIDKLGWLAGSGSRNIWQCFGGDREGSESPWETASRELLEETGILSEHLVSLAPPFFMRKDHHVYVLHIAMIRPAHADPALPMVTSRELTHFRHFTSFGDAFRSELGDGEMIHRRDIEPAFLVIAADIYRAISMQAQASPTSVSPRPASGGSSVGASIAVDAFGQLGGHSASSLDDGSLPRYPLLHESNYFDHEASGRKHARMLSNRISRDAGPIDAIGQASINRHVPDSKRRRIAAIGSRVRRTIDISGHRLAGLPDDPPPSVAFAATPTLLVPDEDQRWSFEFKDTAVDDDDLQLAALQATMDVAYSEPTVVNKETDLLSPPSGTSVPRLLVPRLPWRLLGQARNAVLGAY